MLSMKSAFIATLRRYIYFISFISEEFLYRKTENPCKYFKCSFSMFYCFYVLSRIYFIFNFLYFTWCAECASLENITRHLIKSDNFVGNRKKKLRGGISRCDAEVVIHLRSPRVPFKSKNGLFLPSSLRSSPHIHPLHTRGIGEKLFRRCSVAYVPEAGRARLMRCATRPRWFNRPYFAGEIWRNQGNAFMRAYAVSVMNPLSLSSRRLC